MHVNDMIKARGVSGLALRAPEKWFPVFGKSARKKDFGIPIRRILPAYGNTKSERLAGALYGLLVGDALGVPYEFHPPEQIPSFDHIEMIPPQNFRRSYPRVPPGSWSDDGAQALILLHTLLNRDGFDAAVFANGLKNWRDRGFMACDGVVFAVGAQTEAAIARLRQGVAPLLAGGAGERDNGNGSLMRVAPLALWNFASDADLMNAAFAQSSVTHNHPRSKLCCALYCFWLRRILCGLDIEQAWAEALSALRALLTDAALRAEFETQIASYAANKPTGSGYVVDCLFSARWALQAENFTDAIRRAVSLGNDTDTTACVAGALAGAHFGFASIPARWLEILRGRDIVDPLAARLLALEA